MSILTQVAPVHRTDPIRIGLAGDWVNRPYLQLHQLADVFYRRAAVGNYLVIVFPEIEIFAKLLLRGGAKIEMFADAYEIRR